MLFAYVLSSRKLGGREVESRELNLPALVTISLIFGATSLALAQDAAPPTVDLGRDLTSETTPAPSPTPIPDVPELSVLDEAFKRSSLGKAADENRQRVEIRRLQTRIANDPVILQAKREANTARTDLEKRDHLRTYYTIYYGRLRALAPSEETKKALDNMKAEHIGLLAQPRVRPNGDETPTPVPKKKEKRGKHFPGRPG